jgi:hypothetical protein
MKKQKGVTTLVGVIIILVSAVVLLGGAFAYQYFSGKNLNFQIVNPIYKSSMQTASWKMYTSIKYGFEFKYPQDWSVSEHAGAINLTNKANKENVPIMQILRENTLDGLSAQDAIAQVMSRMYLTKIISSPQKINVDNEIGYQSTGVAHCSLGAPCQTLIAAFSHNSKTYEITYGESGEVEPGTGPSGASSIRKDIKDWKYYDTYKQIISTFKFITQSNQTSDWITYIHNKDGYEVEYPSDTLIENKDADWWDITYITNSKGADITYWYIDVMKNDAYTYDQWVGSFGPSSEGPPLLEVEKISDFKIGGINGKKATFKNSDSINAIVIKNGIAYIFFGENDIVRFNQMLSTFKFLN